MSALPGLVVLGDFHHFKMPLCVMGQLDGLFFTAIPFKKWQTDFFYGSVGFIKWSPWSKYRISDRERSLIPENAHIINDTHFHCDKSVTHEHMLRVFGYSSAVDPTTHHGPGVIKSNRNATHDGVVTQFPLGRRKKGYVYEKLINNLVNDHTILEYRACVLFGEISLVYIKHRPIEERFLVPCTAVKTVKPEAVFTAEEIEKCIAFLRSIGLEYGELDILRDNTDGRLYIIDSNNTPYGPPQILSRSEQQAALEIVGAGVQQTLSKLAVDATHQLNRFSRLRTKADPSGRTTLAALSLRRILGRLRRASLYYLDR